MAQPDLEKFNRRGLLLKLQPIPGTPETPSNSVDGIRLYDGSSGTEVDTTRTNADAPHFAANGMYVSNKRAFIEGTFQLFPPVKPGDAVDGTPPCHAVLLPGGMTRVLNEAGRTTRYNPISAGIPLSTAWWYHAGTHKKAFDARHALSAIALEVSKRFEGKLRVQGSYTDILEAALPVITVSEVDGAVLQAANGRTQITVLPSGDTLTVWGKSLSVDMGTDLKSKEYTGLKVNTIDARDPKFTLRCARTALEDFNPWAVRDASGYITATLRIKQDDGRYSMLGIRGQIETVNEVDIDGDYGWELSGPCVASSAGGDEMFIEFGDISMVLTGELSDDTTGAPYSGTTGLTAIGEFEEPLAWSISAGTLPTGLTINGATGVISGNPSVANTFNFTVKAVDANGQEATKVQSVTITS